jgi:hypothetical protein
LEGVAARLADFETVCELLAGSSPEGLAALFLLVCRGESTRDERLIVPSIEHRTQKPIDIHISENAAKG